MFDPSRPFFQESSPLRVNGWKTYSPADPQYAASSMTLLQLASYLGILTRVEKLLAVKKRGKISNLVHRRDEDCTNSLTCAARRGHDEIVRLLLDRGANINARGRFSMTALQEAASEGNKAVVQLLLARGADVNAGSSTALHKAARGGHKEVMRLLLDHGANIHARDGFGKHYIRQRVGGLRL
ncbi:hypothetical protein VTN77DRAFT_4560 [Rasamsonia byssochlamydoides]|uniref:uncharacterized protein n=1 Tax=Rasamsonia byssochlamydoides TaxID=89139 RepID=UPI00374239F3